MNAKLYCAWFIRVNSTQFVNSFWIHILCQSEHRTEMLRNLLALRNVAACEQTAVRTNCFRACFGKITRPVYARMYPVKLVKPDGSSLTVQYHEPVSIIKLPFNINELDEAERKRRLLKRQMSGKTETKKKDSGILIDKKIKFDPKKYIKKEQVTN